MFDQIKNRDSAGIPFLVALLCVGVTGPVFSQAPPAWTGQAQCQLNIQGSDYVHKEVQTWTITGASTSAPGTMPVYPGTWTVAGQGTMQRSVGPQSLAAQWNTKVPETSAPIAVFVRASDNRLIVKLWHSQLRLPGAIAGVRQVVSASVPSSQTAIGLAAFEWPFPVIEDASNSTSIRGSGTIAIPGTLMPMQAATVNGTANCNWQFHKGADESSPKAPAPATNLARTPIAVNEPVPVSVSNSGSLPLGTTGASGSGSSSSGAAGGAGNAGTASGSAAAGAGNAGASSAGAAGGAGNSGAASGGAAAAGAAAGGAGSAGAASGGGAAGAGNAGAASGGAAAAANSTASGGGAAYPASLSCTDPALLQGPGSPDGPNLLGTIPQGGSTSNSGTLISSTDRKFYQFTLPPGVNASITLSGMQAGSDFDLYAYGSDLTPIGCSLTRGTSSENVKTSFGVTQSNNTVIVEVKSYAWSSASASYSLSINGQALGSGTNLLGNLQNKATPIAAQGVSGSSVPQSCVGAALSPGAGNPNNLGTMSAGQSIVDSGNLTSATDRHFYQVTLTAGIDANISLSGMQPGSDFDLYVYRSDFTPIACSLTRGTGPDNVKTSFGATQTSNIVVVEVRSYAWTAAAPSYSLSISATEASAGGS